MAPAAAALLISSIVAGRRRGLTMPRKTEAGRFGKRTTLPSGCIKNLTRSPGFNRRCSRIAFGIVAWPFSVIADSIRVSHYILEKVIPHTCARVNLRVSLRQRCAPPCGTHQQGLLRGLPAFAQKLAFEWCLRGRCRPVLPLRVRV